ncbi:glyoxalase superfamily protein [Pedobacter sp. BS3]|uniref:glyoxalase superfamily protein n=1 Tax=Pedobacter sp. BS3 TaxID=2567937 RepID=UPI0039790FF1
MLYKSINNKNYKYMRPGLRKLDWDADILIMTVIDPFYNRIELFVRIGNNRNN